LRSHMVTKFMLVKENFKPRHGGVILVTHPKEQHYLVEGPCLCYSQPLKL
ncbi:hypothetical protein EE612_046384, partial [Oryza sativa]